ncbi:hypothetical protein DFH09DRAFT_1336327 [Mycena vulgaris]|nr:hypothetical protein DFH09DRAFT_1336327 [Mycena vulgaris]
MTVCNGCSIDFYGLADDTCHKCKELAGKSEPEKVSIRNKGQCLGCAVVYGELQTVLCNGCSQIYANGDSVPKQIFQSPGANEQLLSFKTSDLTSELWEMAQGFKKTASDHRLGLPRVQNKSLQKAGTASALKKRPPGSAKGPCSQMITFYASETVTKYFNIPEDNLTDGTVSDLLLYLKLNRHVTDAQFEAKQVELKLSVVFVV